MSDLQTARLEVLARIERAASLRPPFEGLAEPRLLAVSKTFPAASVLALAQSGQRDFGENYAQEGVEKLTTCRQANPALELCWHFIGPLQSNKTRLVAEHFDWVHSLDRLKIAQRLNEQRPDKLAPLQVCIQVNISGEATKSGVAPDELAALALELRHLKQLRLRGLMAIPQVLDDPAAQSRAFAALRDCLFATNRLLGPGNEMDQLSMGMSDDLELAVAQGASWLRVGRAIFGHRVGQATQTQAR
jgi:pyridoxal phosphate enzyme (YggS family)